MTSTKSQILIEVLATQIKELETQINIQLPHNTLKRLFSWFKHCVLTALQFWTNGNHFEPKFHKL